MRSSWAEGLPVIQEAVSIYRELAAVLPDQYRPVLADTLTNLGLMLSALGRPSEALPATREAVSNFRELAKISPDKYRPDLAHSLAALALVLDPLDPLRQKPHAPNPLNSDGHNGAPKGRGGV